MFEYFSLNDSVFFTEIYFSKLQWVLKYVILCVKIIKKFRNKNQNFTILLTELTIPSSIHLRFMPRKILSAVGNLGHNRCYSQTDPFFSQCSNRKHLPSFSLFRIGSKND